MKKTVSINIKGINFIIEEDAYEILQNYLERLSATLENEEDSQEIIEDVELRIAEICSSKITDTKTVIEKSDIDEIISTLGNPEDFIDADDAENDQSRRQSNHSSQKSERRLFRDVENNQLAGVCSGIASFLNIDVVIVRAIFVVLFIFAGFGIPLYIILWIIIPRTKSTIDKLRMKGKPITVESVKDEIENAAHKIKQGSSTVASRFNKNDSYKKGINRGARILASILGFGMLAFGIFSIVIFILFGVVEMQVFPVQGDHGFLSLPELGSLVLTSDSDYSLFWYGSLILNSAVSIFFLLLGSMLVFRLYNKWAKITLILLFIAGITGGFMCMAVGLRTGRDFIVTGKIEHSIGVVESNILHLETVLESLPDNFNYKIKSNGMHSLMKIDDKTITFHGMPIYYVPSKDSTFHINQTFSTQSHSHKTAISKSENINHLCTIDSNTVSISAGYSFPKKDKIRGQRVQITIEVPKGGVVYAGDEIINIYNEDDYDEGFHNENGRIQSNGAYDHWY